MIIDTPFYMKNELRAALMGYLHLREDPVAEIDDSILNDVGDQGLDNLGDLPLKPEIKYKGKDLVAMAMENASGNFNKAFELGDIFMTHGRPKRAFKIYTSAPNPGELVYDKAAQIYREYVANNVDFKMVKKAMKSLSKVSTPESLAYFFVRVIDAEHRTEMLDIVMKPKLHENATEFGDNLLVNGARLAAEKIYSWKKGRFYVCDDGRQRLKVLNNRHKLADFFAEGKWPNIYNNMIMPDNLRVLIEDNKDEFVHWYSKHKLI